MKWLDLFSGVGMYALGLEQAGHEVIGFCESEEFCKKVLKKHWPMKPISSCILSLNKKLKELLGDSLVKMYHSQIHLEPPQVDYEVDSSGRVLKPFAWWDQNSYCWKTWQRCLLEGWEKFLGPWPAAGVMRNGIVWDREPLERPTIVPVHTFLPTTGAQEGKGTSRTRYLGSPNFRGAKMSEALRTCETDPIYLNPSFAELVMGLEKDYTLLETETRPASSES